MGVSMSGNDRCREILRIIIYYYQLGKINYEVFKKKINQVEEINNFSLRQNGWEEVMGCGKVGQMKVIDREKRLK